MQMLMSQINTMAQCHFSHCRGLALASVQKLFGGGHSDACIGVIERIDQHPNR